MTEIIGVKFRSDGRVYSFDPDGKTFTDGELVIVDTARGQECGIVSGCNKMATDNELVAPLKKVIRAISKDDERRIADRENKQKEAFSTCEKRILEHKLEMKLVDVEATLDGSKILFYFTADGRIDFRELVKDLASVFRTRIELRQIGVRDEAKILGGLGICGQQFCCNRFLDDFQPVSIKMAKEQGLSLNPVKISGTCGRLMCCLKYEQDVYEHFIKMTPKLGSTVSTPDGNGTVCEVNILSGILKVRLSDRDGVPVVFHRDQLTQLGCKNKPQKQPPLK